MRRIVDAVRKFATRKPVIVAFVCLDFALAVVFVPMYDAMALTGLAGKSIFDDLHTGLGLILSLLAWLF